MLDAEAAGVRVCLSACVRAFTYFIKKSWEAKASREGAGIGTTGDGRMHKDC